MSDQAQRHQTDEDHEVWMRCFTAVLSNALTADVGQGPEEVADLCADIADAALEEERKRRRHPSHLPAGFGSGKS